MVSVYTVMTQNLIQPTLGSQEHDGLNWAKSETITPAHAI